MKILANCPHCLIQIPRSFMLKAIPHINLSCPACNQKIRNEPKAEWLGSIIIGVPIGLIASAAIYDKISWPMAAVGIFILCVVAIVLFPYITRFIVAPEPK